MFKSAHIVLLAALIAPPASAEIFKCVAKNGLDLYQNFPCVFESIDSLPMGGEARRIQPPGDSNAAKLRPAVPQIASSGNSPAALAAPRLGMTIDEVKAVWGEPTEAVQEEPVEGGRIEIWSYGTARSLQFDHRHRVAVIRRWDAAPGKGS